MYDTSVYFVSKRVNLRPRISQVIYIPIIVTVKNSKLFSTKH